MTFVPIVVAERLDLLAQLPSGLAQTEAWQALGVAAVVLACLGMLFKAFRGLRGTTLVAPVVWAAVSLVAIGGVELVLLLSAGAGSSEWAVPLRYVAAMSLFCPTMAVLGAKRPQDTAWQFIVLSLWVVLVLPSGEWLLQSGGEAFEIHPARRWFLAILMAIGAGNLLPTRFWPSGLLLLLGQGLLLGDYLPFGVENLVEQYAVLIGLTLCMLALGLVRLGWPRRTVVARPLERVWLDFRDLFGAVWGLRIIERMNSTGRICGWNVLLGWHGFCAANGEHLGPIEPQQAAQIEDALRTLLRRFVSPEWIAARLDQP